MHQQTNQQTKLGHRKSARRSGRNYPFTYYLSATKVGNFLLCSNKPTNYYSFLTEKVDYMEQKVEKITRERLRAMRNGDILTVECADGYDLDSQRNTAYALQSKEGCKYSCKAEGLLLQVTRYGNE